MTLLIIKICNYLLTNEIERKYYLVPDPTSPCLCIMESVAGFVQVRVRLRADVQSLGEVYLQQHAYRQGKYRHRDAMSHCPRVSTAQPRLAMYRRRNDAEYWRWRQHS